MRPAKQMAVIDEVRIDTLRRPFKKDCLAVIRIVAHHIENARGPETLTIVDAAERGARKGLKG